MTHTFSEEVVFKEGNTVAWKNPDDPLIVKCGPGPFKVAKIISVPLGYASGQTKSTRESVGHSQWLIIQDQDRNVIHNRDGPQKFSGKWFRKVG